MLNIFYQKSTLKDTLVINLSTEAKLNVKTVDGFVTIGTNDDNKISFINIKNISSKIKLNNGLLFPTKKLVEIVKSLTKVNILDYFDNGFIVGVVKSAVAVEKTHLHICKVDIGTKELDIICGAKNVREGLKVVVVTNGTQLPNGSLITAGSVLGHKSQGMLCSYKELGIESDKQGIIELSNEVIGSYFMSAYK